MMAVVWALRLCGSHGRQQGQRRQQNKKSSTLRTFAWYASVVCVRIRLIDTDWSSAVVDGFKEWSELDTESVDRQTNDYR